MDEKLLRAKQGDAEAQFEIGDKYLFEYRKTNSKKVGKIALHWLLASANQGYVQAQYVLARCYLLGRVVSEDNTEAINWYKKAAQQGHEQSQYMLALGYYCGEGGLKKDIDEAIYWSQDAAKQGNPYAQYLLGSCYFHLKSYKYYEKAFYWLNKAAEQGVPEAKNLVGICYELGLSVEKDLVKALDYYIEAAELGEADAMFNIGIYVYRGKGGIIDRNYGMQAIHTAIAHGSIRAKEFKSKLDEKKSPKSRNFQRAVNRSIGKNISRIWNW